MKKGGAYLLVLPAFLFTLFVVISTAFMPSKCFRRCLTLILSLTIDFFWLTL